MNEITVIKPDTDLQLAAILVEKMREGVVTFAYKKESTGEARIAHGTLNKALFHYEYKSADRKPSEGIITYWDMDKQGWRSLHEGNILQIL